MIVFGRKRFGRKGFLKRLGMCRFADLDGDDDGGGAGGGMDDSGNGSFDINLDLNQGDGDEDGGDDSDKGDGDSSSLFEIPEAYKEKEYAKGLKSNDDVWKMLDGAQKKIGEKTIVAGIPGEEATEEEIKEFNKLWGVPEKADDYKIEPDEAITAMYGEADKAVMGQFKELLHKAGANEKQAAILKEGYSGIVNGILDGFKSKQEEADKQFDALVEKTFGDKQDEVLETAKKLISAHAPEGFTEQIGKLPSESLVIMAGVLENIREKYIDEDELGPKGGGNSGMSEASAQAEIQKVIGSEAFRNPLHAEHDSAKAEFNRLSGVLDGIRRGKK